MIASRIKNLKVKANKISTSIHFSMKILKPFFIIIFLIAASIQTTLAQEMVKKSSPVRFIVGAGLELGGDKVADVYFTNGNTQSVNAGQGGSIAVGGQLEFPGLEKLLLRTTVGFKYVTTAADNVHIRLTRIPVHVTTHWMFNDKWGVGAGLASHRNIKFKADGIGEDINFKGATGPRFEIAYKGISLSYTSMKYQDNYDEIYSANAVGLWYMLTIPNR